jgi:hypothetical protein
LRGWGHGKSEQALPRGAGTSGADVVEYERPVGSREERPFARLFYTPYWTTFELLAIDMKTASVGTLHQVVEPPERPGRFMLQYARSLGHTLRVEDELRTLAPDVMHGAISLGPLLSPEGGAQVEHHRDG